MTIRQFTFPGENSFSIDVNTRTYAPDNAVISLSLYKEMLYLYHTNMYNSTIISSSILGWTRQAFPLCCGVEIVSILNHRWSDETMEKWWKWMETLTPQLLPAIGIIPCLLDDTNNIKPIEARWNWFASKGVQWGDPIKNILYPNHVLIPYLFFPHKGIEKILKPKFGMFADL